MTKGWRTYGGGRASQDPAKCCHSRCTGNGAKERLRSCWVLRPRNAQPYRGRPAGWPAAGRTCCPGGRRRAHLRVAPALVLVPPDHQIKERRQVALLRRPAAGRAGDPRVGATHCGLGPQAQTHTSAGAGARPAAKRGVPVPAHPPLTHTLNASSPEPPPSRPRCSPNPVLPPRPCPPLRAWRQFFAVAPCWTRFWWSTNTLIQSSAAYSSVAAGRTLCAGRENRS